MLNPKTETHSLERSLERRACAYLLWTQKSSPWRACFVLYGVFSFIDQSAREVKRADELQRLAEKRQQQTSPKMWFKISKSVEISWTISEEEKQTWNAKWWWKQAEQTAEAGTGWEGAGQVPEKHGNRGCRVIRSLVLSDGKHFLYLLLSSMSCRGITCH